MKQKLVKTRNPVAYYVRTNRLGAGAHRNKKAYTRKIKHKKKLLEGL